MRPLRLRLKGLRSYRAETVVDFTELGLVAVIGDTGAGKSSLLEAILYALYNESTFDGRGGGALLANGATTMQVSLEFAAEGSVWRVTRSFSPSRSPASTHKLERLPPDAPATVDGDRAVTSEIGRLVGLGSATFKKTVILPQGRFDDLLKATPADRTKILSGIFGLEQLGEIRRSAQRLGKEVSARLLPLRLERAGLPEDPIAERDARGAALRRADTELRALEGRRRELSDAEAELERQQSLGARAGAAALALDGAGEAALGRMRHALAEEERLEGLDALDRRLAESLDERIGGLAQALRRWADEGLSRERISGVRITLARLASELPRLAAGEAALDAQAAALEDERRRHEDAAPDSALETAAAVASAARDEAESDLEAARQRRHAAQAALERGREAVETHRAAALTASDAADRLAAAQSDARRARAERASARSTAEGASAEREAAERSDAAAHAAEGLSPDDHCPICHRALPEGFAPPAGTDLAASRLTEQQALARRADADSTAVIADERTAAAIAGLRRAEEALDAALEARRARVADLAELTVRGDPDLADEALLDDLSLREAERRDALTRAQAEVESSMGALAARAASREAASARLRERAAELAARRLSAEEEAERLESARAALPGRGRPRPGGGPQAVGEAVAALDEVDRAQADLAAQIERHRDEAASLARAQASRAEARRCDVDEPRSQARRALDLLAGGCAGAAEILGEAAPEPCPERAGARAELDWAQSLVSGAVALAPRLSASATAALVAAAAAATRAAQTLRRAGVADADALSAARDMAAGVRHAAQAASDRAERELPQALALDARIAPAKGLLEDIEELSGVLTEGRFPHYAVTKRQQALLGVASEILLDMTGRRYAFDADFTIVDVPAGLSRGVRTLSGGETFLASLALALALVELTGRAGGRVEALFLDEGFGALDAAALDEALDELERRAREGRLVGVVSHVHAVAERIESVLHVRFDTDHGSSIEVLTGAAREELLESGAAGLVSA